MSRRRTSKGILRRVASVQRELKKSQRNIDIQFRNIVSQIQHQIDSTFDGQTCTEASWPKFADRLVTHGKALIELGERLKSGTPPQWVSDQQAAYENSAIGRLRKLDRTDHTGK